MPIVTSPMLTPDRVNIESQSQSSQGTSTNPTSPLGTVTFCLTSNPNMLDIPQPAGTPMDVVEPSDLVVTTLASIVSRAPSGTYFKP